MAECNLWTYQVEDFFGYPSDHMEQVWNDIWIIDVKHTLTLVPIFGDPTFRQISSLMVKGAELVRTRSLKM